MSDDVLRIAFGARQIVFLLNGFPRPSMPNSGLLSSWPMPAVKTSRLPDFSAESTDPASGFHRWCRVGRARTVFLRRCGLKRKPFVPIQMGPIRSSRRSEGGGAEGLIQRVARLLRRGVSILTGRSHRRPCFQPARKSRRSAWRCSSSMGSRSNNGRAVQSSVCKVSREARFMY